MKPIQLNRVVLPQGGHLGRSGRQGVRLAMSAAVSAVVSAVVGACLVVAMPNSPAFSAPLAKAECQTLKVELDAMTAMGVADDMAKGPDVVKATATPARIEQIRRYLQVFEQLAFRCSMQIAALGLGAGSDDVNAASNPAGASTAGPILGKPVTGAIALPQRKPSGKRNGQTGQLRPAIDPQEEAAGSRSSDNSGNGTGGRAQVQVQIPGAQITGAQITGAPVVDAPAAIVPATAGLLPPAAVVPAQPKPPAAKKAAPAAKPREPVAARSDNTSALPSVFQSLR